DYRLPVAATRAREGPRPRDIATVGLADALAGGVGIVFGTLYVAPEGTEILGGPTYRTAEEAHAQAREQLAIYRRLAEHPQIMLIETRADLAAVLAAWEAGKPQLGIVVLMEGADPIRVPEEAETWQA